MRWKPAAAGSVVSLIAALSAVVAPGRVVAAPVPSPWVRPVAGAVLAPFVAPAFAYGPGHRGVDLAAPAGTPVRAAGSGAVVFAGPVADQLHVVVQHRSGLRTGYSFLADLRVVAGQAVEAGAILGHTGGEDPDSGHGADTLHFSLRRGATYLDPMLLYVPVDLTAVVRLAPLPPGWR